MPLAVTEQASAELKQVLGSVEHEPDQALRLVTDPEGNFKLALDTEREGDQVVEHEGETVMVIGPPVSERLSGATLDARETPDGVVLTFST